MRFERLVDAESWSRIDAVAGVESRGFILAGRSRAPRQRVLCRFAKQGKLPPPVVDMEYTLE